MTGTRPLPLTVPTIAKVAVVAVCIAATTGSPAFLATRHWALNIDFLAWPYAYAAAIVTVCGIAFLAWDARGAIKPVTAPELVAIITLGSACLLALVSATWSVNVFVTPERAINLTGACAFGIWLGRFARSSIRLGGVMIGVHAAVLASAWAHLRSWPGVIDEYDSWLGAFPNRNGLGATCGFGVVVAVAWGLGRLHPVRTTVAGAAVALDLYLLAGSGSATPVAALLIATLLLGAIHAARRSRRAIGRRSAAAGVGGMTVLLAMAVIVVRNLDSVTSWFGRDDTLSARRLMWREVRAQLATRPARGFGYDAFWTVPELVAPVETNVGGVVVYAHNTFLEFGLGVGWGGLIAVLAFAVVAGGAAIAWVWRSGGLQSSMWLAIYVLALAQNMMESASYLLSTGWVLLVAAGFAATRALGPRTGHTHGAAVADATP